MSNSSAPHASARRALIEDIKADTRGWLRHGVAALAVSVLGLGIAGSVTMVGAAQHTTGQLPAQTLAADAVPVTEASTGPVGALDQTSATSAQLSSAKLKSMADQRAEQLNKTEDQIASAAKDKAAQQREAALADESDQADKQANLLANHSTATAGGGTQVQPKAAPKVDVSTLDTSGKSCLPVTTGYSVAARFGQLGPWARYHTGFDFSAPVGTPLHAPAAGVVENAGIGPASGWAGNYVAIRYPDGTQSLMAHMSTVSVQVGQTVSACQLVGAIGMTGRTFGPHVHFEIYPAGITPGNVYRAVNPVPWLNAHGLKP